MTRILLVSALALGAMTAGTWLAPAAYAAKFKVCGTQTVDTGRDHQTQTITEIQIAQCTSNSDTGEEFVPGPVKNKGGNEPPGQQP